MEALSASVLGAELGETGVAELVTVAPARSSPWSTRVIAMTREFRRTPVRERVLLVLPVGRSPPRGAILEATVRVTEPRPSRDGFDEHAWLARQGIHVVLDASSWRQVGRRGGIAGLGDRLRDRIERAVGRGTDGVRRAIVLGVVLGEDEGLPAPVQDDFRASGLYHLLAVSGQNVAFLAAGVFGLGWLLRLPRVARELVTVGVIAAYVLAVGWQPSVARAAVAGTLASLAWLDCAADRPLALPRGRSARTPRLDADVGAGSGLSALVRCGGGHLRRRSPPSHAPRRAAAPAGRRRGVGGRPRLRSRNGADRPPPFRPGAALHGARERRGLRRRAARSRVRAAGGPRRPRLTGRRGRARVPRGLGGSLAGPRRARRGGSPERAARRSSDDRDRACRRRLLARRSPHPTASGPRRAPATRRARARSRNARRGRRRVGGHAARTGLESARRPAGHVPRRRTGRFGAPRDAVERGSSSTKGLRRQASRRSCAEWASGG